MLTHLQYLGIPLAAGVVTRFIAKRALSPNGFTHFLKVFGPLALLGLLCVFSHFVSFRMFTGNRYTIVILFAYQVR
jgi:arsenite transporter